MTCVLPTEEATKICLSMMEEFDRTPNYSALLSKGCGKHFGALICTDGTVLKAFSGQLFGSYLAEGYVPPCFEDSASVLSSSTATDLHALYRFYCFDGKVRSLYEGAPTGTGDCCEPKLLSYCYEIGKKPLSMACFFYGDGSFEHKAFSTPCSSRCKRLLPLILGLDIVYLDSSIVVVNKPSGLLAIEGKTCKDSVAYRVKSLFPDCISQPCVHRLDMATSGLMVLGLTSSAHRTLSSMFEKRLVSKEYVALVHGEFPSDISGYCGRWVIKQRLDVDNRPMQIVDEVYGKEAVTDWKRIGTVRIDDNVYTKLLLSPLTGRTHQLRLACAVNGHPIVGDSLYSSLSTYLSTSFSHSSSGSSSLMLCARHLEFDHPETGEHLAFEISEP